MTNAVNYLLVVRLDNAASIGAAYGDDAVQAALDHLYRGMEKQIGPAELRRKGDGEIEVLTWAVALEPQFMNALTDELCMSLSMDPFQHAGSRILLSVSAGYAVADGPAMKSAEEQAHGRKIASTAQADHPVAHSRKWQWLYRHDMARAAVLLDQVRLGDAFLVWRPVYNPQNPGQVLHYEASLRTPGDRGEQIDCAEARGSLERLGLSYLLDRQLTAQVVEELAEDPFVRLSIGISAQSLSFHLNGQDAAWTELLAQLRKSRNIASRLVVEIQEAAPITSLPDALAFVSELRELGVRVSVAGFGSGFASIRQLLVLHPDIVKLDAAFLQTAGQSDRNRARLAHLLGLARTLGDTIIMDGVETPTHMHLAIQENAEWVASSHHGRATARRVWLNPVANGIEASSFAAPFPHDRRAAPAMQPDPVRL